VNLTDPQRHLLRRLVAAGSTECYFKRFPFRTWMSYSVSGMSAPVVSNDGDLQQLQSQGFISLTPVSADAQTVRLTPLGYEVDAQLKAETPVPVAGPRIFAPPVLSESTKHELGFSWEAILEHHQLSEWQRSEYNRGRQLLSDNTSKRMDSQHRRKLLDEARQLGLASSEKATEAAFRAIESEYESLWHLSGAPPETYGSWLDSAKRQVTDQLTRAWKSRSRVTDDWYEKTCRPAVEKILTALVNERLAHPREVDATVGIETHPPEAFESKGEGRAAISDPVAAARRQAVDAYIEEVWGIKHKRITRTDFWMAAGYKTRSAFERWERNAPNRSKAADRNFSRILREKPHLK
jgi:hypothetical protein